MGIGYCIENFTILNDLEERIVLKNNEHGVK